MAEDSGDYFNNTVSYSPDNPHVYTGRKFGITGKHCLFDISISDALLGMGNLETVGIKKKQAMIQ